MIPLRKKKSVIISPMITIDKILNEEKKWRIRSITDEDLDELCWGELYRPYINLMKLSLYDHKMEKKVYLVVEVDGKIAGQIIIDWRILKDETKSNGKTRAYLYSFRVFPPYRGRGLGTAMVLFCEQFLKERGFKHTTIAVEKNNPRALALYEKLGYKTYKDEDTEWDYLDDKGIIRKVKEPEWVMEKVISAPV